MIRLFMAILMSFVLSLPVLAQEPAVDRSATGGAQDPERYNGASKGRSRSR